jgi:SAM-dependent methyltransferase
LPSLCYAKRKTLELGLSNIEYKQGDILELAIIGRTFDLVQAVGVLHHLAAPEDGLKALYAVLRPGGFMNLGLYSELARRNIVAAQAFVAQRGYGKTADDIRQCRQELASFDDGFRAEMAQCDDWFSTSGCRDLLFHEQEHRMTLPQIKSLLADLGLVFLGFDLDSRVRLRYAERFPADKAMTDLDSWNVFEAEHPQTFLSMYQFWVQRPLH